jgi:hypothetical protein
VDKDFFVPKIRYTHITARLIKNDIHETEKKGEKSIENANFAKDMTSKEPIVKKKNLGAAVWSHCKKTLHGVKSFCHKTPKEGGNAMQKKNILLKFGGTIKKNLTDVKSFCHKHIESLFLKFYLFKKGNGKNGSLDPLTAGEMVVIVQYPNNHETLFDFRVQKNNHYNTSLGGKKSKIAIKAFPPSFALLEKYNDYVGALQCANNWISYQEDTFVYRIKLQILEILRRWNGLVNQGNIVRKFGDLALNLRAQIVTMLENIPIRFDAAWITMQIAEWLVLRIKQLFKKQVVSLQEKALEFFESALLRILMAPQKNYSLEKTLLHLKVMGWFEKKSKSLDAPPFTASKKATVRMGESLREFALQFKKSPVVQLHMLDRTEKQMSPSNIKEKSLVVGFGLTAAVRPPGFGNFQFISHYSHGPHVFNFSLVNDRDAAQQEGQSQVQNVRIQPSLNFEIDL